LSTGIVIREAVAGDATGIDALLRAAFGGPAEADLVAALRTEGDKVLELVAEADGEPAGGIFFSRLLVGDDPAAFPAVALAPLAVTPGRLRAGIGSLLMERAHAILHERGERLSVVLGDAAYYERFGYRHARAAGFDSAYQCEHLQALAWGEAPTTGRLHYARAFAGL